MAGNPGRPHGTKKTEIHEDLKHLPEDVARAHMTARRIDALAPTSCQHYIYRWNGEGQKVAVGKWENPQLVPPTAFDLGERYRRGGNYEILTKVYFKDESGKTQDDTISSGILLVGDDYEVPPAAAGAAVPAAAVEPRNAGILGELGAGIMLLEQLSTIVVRLQGGKTESTDEKAISRVNDHWSGVLRESEETYRASLKNIRKEFEEKIERIESDRTLRSKAVEKPAFDLAEVLPHVGSGMKLLKEGMDLFKGAAGGGAP